MKKMMPITDQQATQGEACQTSRPVSWLAETASENPQISDYRARYYDQSAGRFISEDPLRFRAGVNSYPYVVNNPVFYLIPMGLSPVI